MQSAKNLPDCQYTMIADPLIVDASAAFTFLHQQALQPSDIPSDHNLGFTPPGSAVGVYWLAYSVMRSVTDEGWRPRLEEVYLHELQFTHSPFAWANSLVASRATFSSAFGFLSAPCATRCNRCISICRESQLCLLVRSLILSQLSHSCWRAYDSAFIHNSSWRSWSYIL